jgi:anthranilate synthase/aminodeoxychorismate synthase-like glutamine amidotransferase
MLLIIDNYDSFTYNLYQYFSQLGAEVVVVRHDAVDIPGIEAMAPSHLVISPGPCTPQQAGISLQAIAHFAGRLPILGVCLGHQCIAEHFGGRVERAAKVMHGKTSPVYHHRTGLFADLPNPLEATRYHSLHVPKASLPDCLEVTAWTQTADGQPDMVMGIKHRTLAIEGVQFHPESILTQKGLALLKNFIRE